MKPCRSQKKLIALSTSDALDARLLGKLKLHLQDCEGCREYAASLSAVCHEHVNAAGHERGMPEEAQDRIMARLGSVQKAAASGQVSTLFSGWVSLWRWAFAFAACAAAVVVWRLGNVGEAPRAVEVQPAMQTTSAPAKKDVDPSLLSYRLAASHSWEALDELLTRHEPHLLKGEEAVFRPGAPAMMP